MSGVNVRRVVISTILYGLADSVVVLIGGLLLLPLYTSTLTRPEFGSYIAIRVNLELMTCLLHFGLISAVSRLYFDYVASGNSRRYVTSIALWFPVHILALAAVVALFGQPAWALLAPSVSAWPYLGFVLAIAAANFYFNLTTTLLRAQQRVGAFVAVQLGTAAMLAGAAYYLLVVRHFGLPGLMGALLVSALAGAIMLPLAVRGGGLRVDPEHVRRSLRYALPIVGGLLAYFILTRASVLILQRYVDVADLALYGLAQQIALIVAVAAAAFGKAIQPILFGAEPDALPALLRRTMAIFVVPLSAVASLILIFGSDIIALIAPASYRDTHPIMLILVTGAFAYGLTLASDTAVLCLRKPGASAAITAGGAALAALLSAVLIPRLGLIGGAGALLITSITLTVVADRVAWRLTGFSNLVPALCGLAVVAATALLANCIHELGVTHAHSLIMRCLIATGLVAGHLLVLRRFMRAPNVQLAAAP